MLRRLVPLRHREECSSKSSITSASYHLLFKTISTSFIDQKREAKIIFRKRPKMRQLSKHLTSRPTLQATVKISSQKFKRWTESHLRISASLSHLSETARKFSRRGRDLVRVDHSSSSLMTIGLSSKRCRARSEKSFWTFLMTTSTTLSKLKTSPFLQGSTECLLSRRTSSNPWT